MNGAPIIFTGQHKLNLGLGILLLVLIVVFVVHRQPVGVLADRAAGARRSASC